LNTRYNRFVYLVIKNILLLSWRNSFAGCLCFRIFLIANTLRQAKETRPKLKKYHPKAWCLKWLGQTAKRLLTRLQKNKSRLLEMLLSLLLSKGNLIARTLCTQQTISKCLFLGRSWLNAPETQQSCSH